jgi:ribosome modulation factor
MIATRAFALVVGSFVFGLVMSLFMEPAAVLGSTLPIAPTVWTYDIQSGPSQACAPLADRLVRKVMRGYEVTIAPGMHPMVPYEASQVSAFILQGSGRVRLSGDGRRHVCVNGAGKVFAVYVPATAE